MKVVIDQPIAAGAEDVRAAFLSPDFYQSLDGIENISAPVVRSFSRGADRASFVLAYKFSGELNGLARRMLDPEKLTWSQEAEVDLATGRSTIRMVPDNYANLLSFTGWYEFQEEGQRQCRQHMEADLRVHVPLVGALAERAIAGSIRDNVAVTARLVERFLDQRAGRGSAAR